MVNIHLKSMDLVSVGWLIVVCACSSSAASTGASALIHHHAASAYHPCIRVSTASIPHHFTGTDDFFFICSLHLHKGLLVVDHNVVAFRSLL